VNPPAVLPYPNVLGPACGAAPVKPAYVTGFPAANCDTLCAVPGGGRKSGQKFQDLTGNGVKDPTDPGLPNWEMRVYLGGVFFTSMLTDASGNYEFNLLPGTYVVCEVLQPGWTQTFPVAAGGNVVSCDNLEPGVNLAPLGYEFTITTGSVETDNDFGNFTAPCLKFPGLSPNRTITLDPLNPTQVQTAIDNAAAGEVILLMPQNATKSENIVVNKRIQLIGCSVTLTAAEPNLPVVRITSGAASGLTKDVHATGSGVAGYHVEGNGHNVQNVRAFGNGIGFHVTGSGNTLKGTLGTTNNGIGFKVEGSGNILDTNNDVTNNAGDGVVIAGGSGNVVKKLTASGNGGNGFKVEAGATNTTLSENKAFSNGGNGFLVLGNNTPMSKNVAGDIGTGNTGDGIRVAGNGGAITENQSRANGRVGIRVTGTGHSLAKNKSGGSASQNNSSCQYAVGPSNTNGGSNKTSANAAFNFAAAGASSPAGCVPAPPVP
jgi:parallel beta-helix repeat protein